MKRPLRNLLGLAFLLLAGVNAAQAQSNLSVRVNAANDDMEEYLTVPVGASEAVGDMDNASSDLELGYAEQDLTYKQIIGIRFSSLALPKNAVITNAYIQFTVDNTNKNASPCELTVTGEASDNAVTYNPTVPFNISSRPKTTAFTDFTLANWTVIGESGVNQRTGDISTIITEVINRSGWAQGNAIAFFVEGNGLREAESYDGDAASAPLLYIEYYVPVSLSVRVNAASDDMEEFLAVPVGSSIVVGSMDAGSSDLELGYQDNTQTEKQLVGIRFNNITIPQGATITNAYIQFAVDATSKNVSPCDLTVKGEATDNALTFNDANPFNLSSRTKTTASVNFTMPNWTTVGDATADQRTADVKDIIQEIVDRGGWVSGNALALYLEGTGLREAESYDGDPNKAPQLVIEYLGTAGNATTSYPINKGESWSYADQGTLPAANWNQLAYNDDSWAYANGSFGYGDGFITKTISYGADPNNKYVTYYFRKEITIADVNALPTTVQMNLMCDDGAIVYINGTEVTRFNMPTGAVNNSTLASSTIDGMYENIFRVYSIPRSAFVTGNNIVAVEVHQASVTSSDLAFDLQFKTPGMIANPAGMSCTGNADHIACFTSMLPTAQYDTLKIPATHAFQYLFVEGDAYLNATGNALGSFDFTGFIPKDMTSSTEGHLSVNHETNPGGVSMLDIEYNETTETWELLESRPIDFSSVVKTERNCSGGVTPWETVITSEETLSSGDANSDGFQDVGWNVEIDPATNTIPSYGTGTPQKLWAMGRISHENVVIASDSLTAYYGEDAGNGNVFKFVANNKMDMSSGTLYVLKLTSGLSSNEPTSSIGDWVVVPNTTQADCNNTKSLAAGLGGTFFSGVEDVEISPVDGKIYFTAKGNNRTYRFTDNGTTVSNFETFVGGRSYLITFDGGVIDEDWASGNDNLTFDDLGNLWVLQDGSRNHVWVVRPDHTQAAPKVELFMVSPKGSEPTGMTFSPDHNFMFISIQGPSGVVAQTDIKGVSKTWNKSTTIVIARKELLDGEDVVTSITAPQAELTSMVFPNPATEQAFVRVNLKKSSEVEIRLYDVQGKSFGTVFTGTLNGTQEIPFSMVQNGERMKGLIMVQVIVDGIATTHKLQVN